MASPEMTITGSTRVFPRSKTNSSQAVPLSLLDATTVNFSLTSATWIFDRPRWHRLDAADLFDHLRHTLGATLDAYPHFAGTIKAVTTADGTVPEEAAAFPPHARRFGRVYVHFGTVRDPGVGFTAATSSVTVDDLYNVPTRRDDPLWDRESCKIGSFTPADAIANPFDDVGTCPADENGKPVMAVQVTKLAAGGGFVLAAKAAHPLVDITGLTRFVRDWGSISHALLFDLAVAVPRPCFDPSKVDQLAAGDINSSEPEGRYLEAAKRLPLHRYDWWAPAASCPWTMRVPEPFRQGAKDDLPLPPAGDVLPWPEWNVEDPVHHYVLHFTRDQAELLYRAASGGSDQKVSRHDAILAHVWSRVVRARGLGGSDLVHCDLVYSVRRQLRVNCGDYFVGSPMLMINVEMSAAEVLDQSSSPATTTTTNNNNKKKLGGLGAAVPTRIRDTINKVAQPDSIAAHLHGLAYEKSPQRIWQAFLGRRHIVVTSWARAGVYDVDFGLGPVRYVDSVMPNLDGIVVIKEAPPPPRTDGAAQQEKGASSWTEAGVDVSVHLEAETMKRFLQDPLLLPSCL